MTAPPVDETHGDTDLVTSSRNRETPTPPYNGPFCPAEKKRKVIWTATRPDSIATLPCPNNIDCRFCVSKALCVCLLVCPNVCSSRYMSFRWSLSVCMSVCVILSMFQPV